MGFDIWLSQSAFVVCHLDLEESLLAVSPETSGSHVETSAVLGIFYFAEAGIAYRL